MTELRHTLYTALCLTALLCTMSGCIEEYEADIAVEDSHLLVVEGTICAGRLNTFVLSRTQAINDDKLLDLEIEAQVSVRGTDGTVFPAQNWDGSYNCLIDHLDPDVEYYLHIEVDGETYESEPQKPLPTGDMALVEGVIDPSEGSVDVLVTTAEPSDTDHEHYYMWSYDETWEVHPDYTTVMYYDPFLNEPVKKADLFPKRGWVDNPGTTVSVGASGSYKQQHIQRMKIYDIQRTDQRILYGYSGLVHQRAITKAEYEYELARRQASENMGGLFTPLPSALPSNIHCLTAHKHVIGYVGCSLNTSDCRFFLDGDEYAIRPGPKADTRTWLHNPSPEECLQMYLNGMQLCEWESPMMSPDGLLHTAWAHIYQVDVRYKYPGAYIKEPDFWPHKQTASY